LTTNGVSLERILRSYTILILIHCGFSLRGFPSPRQKGDAEREGSEQKGEADSGGVDIAQESGARHVHGLEGGVESGEGVVVGRGNGSSQDREGCTGSVFMELEHEIHAPFLRGWIRTFFSLRD
jgi:hypothetical protein